jgi:hypothetical protein
MSSHTPMRTKLTPIQHATLNDHHRVPVAHILGKYEVYVGDNYIRLFDEDDLPEEIKLRLTMIRAGTIEEPDFDMKLATIQQIYEGDPNGSLFEIGWQVAKNLYVVVLPTKYLTYLKGAEYKLAFRTALGQHIACDRPTIEYLEDFRWERPLRR